jgi:hypothetical protein
MRPLLALAVFCCATLAASACLDPLYEEGLVLPGDWAPCCKQGNVDTCECATVGCSYAFRSCRNNRCTFQGASCNAVSQDAGVAGGPGGGSGATGGSSATGGNAGTGGGSASGGSAGTGGGSATGGSGTGGSGGSGTGGSGMGGGSGADGGLPGDAGQPFDGGAPDAGPVLDAGPGADAGPSPDAGPPSDAGQPPEPEFTPCCVQGTVATCECAPQGCSTPAFLACPFGRCAPPGGRCP